MSPKSLLAPALSLFLALLAVTAPLGADTTQAGPQASDVASRLDALFAEAFPADEPGGTVLVRRGDEILLRKGYGLADLELGVATEPHMIFRIGSITKQFTAVAILMLVEDGKLSLDATLRDVLPEYPAAQGDQVTVRHLLTHTSGIPSYTEMQEFWEVADEDLSLEEMIDYFDEKELEFAPGSQWKYNNSGYFLLGAILEKVSGMSYADFVRTRIFEPLGMTSSSYGDPRAIVKGRVEGYQPEGEDRFVLAQPISMKWPYSAGALLSSVDDLDRWNQALYGTEMLPAERLAEAWTAYELADGTSSGYGFGWSIGTYGGSPVIQHSGGIHGFRSQGLRMPAERIYIAILTNGSRAAPVGLSMRAASMLLGVDYPSADEAPTIAPEVLARYAGVYRIDEETVRVVTVEDGVLHTKRGDGPKFPVVPRSDTEFFYEDSLTELEFVVENGEVVAQIVRPWGGEDQRAERTDEAIPEGPAVAEVDPELFARVEGKYELQPGFVLHVFRDGDQLMTQATGQPAIEIHPSSPTEFFNEQVGARIVFDVPEGAEKATSLTLHQRGATLPAPRIED